ncbi:MAG: SRPBCC family protein [Candidatus Dormiibacterota bacterium]
MKHFDARLTRHCAAPPEAVYDTLADLRTHLLWGGDEQAGSFRLLSLDAPDGAAGVGASFSTTGSIPMSVRRWSDRSTVTIAQRPATFEFVTEATVQRGRRPMRATYRHRYEIAAAAGGADVTYTFTELATSHPFLRLGLPIIRTLTWRLGIPYLAGRGFRNLVATAERRASPHGVAITAPKGPQPVSSNTAS